MSVLSMAAAAKALGVSEGFVLGMTLSGVRPPAGDVIEIEYEMDGNEPTFTRQGIERFLKRCPIGEFLSAARTAEQLGVQRPLVTALVYTGVTTAEGAVVRLPAWEVGGGQHFVRSDVEAFAVHHKAAVERKAAREHAKKYRGRRKATEA